MCGTPCDELEYKIEEVCITTNNNETKYILTDDKFGYFAEYTTFTDLIQWFNQNMNLGFVLKQSVIITKIANGRSITVKKYKLK